MGKTKRGDREIAKEQIFLKENKMLKRENSRLRKELARFSLNKYENVKEAIEEHGQDGTTQDLLNSLKKEWACKNNDCNGYLEVILFNKLDVMYYFRKCNCCPNRTQSQKYNSNVKGIIKN